MDDATQKLVDESRERPTIALAREISSWDQDNPGSTRIPHWAVNLAAHLLDKGYAQRPPVSPEVEDALVDAIEEAWTDDDPEFSRVIARRILARFSFPSQPVYDEEKIVDWLRDQFFEGWWTPRAHAEYRGYAADLVAALRGGELTREETNRG